MAFSDAIGKALQRKSISPKKLAGLSGVSHQHILRILHDESNVTFKTVTKIAVALGYDPIISFESVEHYPEVRISADDFAKQSIAEVWDYASKPRSEGQPRQFILPQSDNFKQSAWQQC